jgi:hypothetical protein
VSFYTTRPGSRFKVSGPDQPPSITFATEPFAPAGWATVGKGFGIELFRLMRKTSTAMIGHQPFPTRGIRNPSYQRSRHASIDPLPIQPRLDRRGSADLADTMVREPAGRVARTFQLFVLEDTLAMRTGIDRGDSKWDCIDRDRASRSRVDVELQKQQLDDLVAERKIWTK